MRLLQDMGRTNDPKVNFEMQGLAGWVFGLLRGWRGERTAQRKQMRVVETLALGGRRTFLDRAERFPAQFALGASARSSERHAGRAIVGCKQHGGKQRGGD